MSNVPNDDQVEVTVNGETRMMSREAIAAAEEVEARRIREAINERIADAIEAGPIVVVNEEGEKLPIISTAQFHEVVGILQRRATIAHRMSR